MTAPILVTVYNRDLHFRNCIESLSRNTGANITTLFVAIDYPSRKEDEKPNITIQEYCQTIKGFKEVRVILRKKNVGAMQNYLQAEEEIYATYDRMIYTEDDNVFSTAFMSFINEGLERYYSDERVFSISGYCYPIKYACPENDNAFLAKAYSAWGVGLWRDKMRGIDFKASQFWEKRISIKEVISINRKLGDRIFPSLVVAKKKATIYADSAISYHLLKNDQNSIFPSITLVQNNGHDGSGMNCGVDAVYSRQEMYRGVWNSIELSKVKEDTRLRGVLNKYFKIGFFRKIYYYIWYHIVFAFDASPLAVKRCVKLLMSLEDWCLKNIRKVRRLCK